MGDDDLVSFFGVLEDLDRIEVFWNDFTKVDRLTVVDRDNVGEVLLILRGQFGSSSSLAPLASATISLIFLKSRTPRS